MRVPGLERSPLPVVFGTLLLLAVPALLVLVLLQPAVRTPLLRTAGTIAGDFLGDPASERRLPLPASVEVHPGLPVWDAAPDAAPRPVAWVLRREGDAVVVRLAPGTDRRATWVLHAIPAPLDFGDALAVAVPPRTAATLKERMLGRASRLFSESLWPEVKKHLPDLLARVDPRSDPEAREVFDAVAASLSERLRPLVGSLGDRVVSDMKHKFDLWDRVGLLWRVVRGDGKGLKKRLLPVAEESVQHWWDEHRDEVLTAVGEGFQAEAPRIQRWLEETVLPVALDQVAAPVFEAKRKELEHELEAAVGEVMDSVVTAPEGGFRVRFAAVVRNRLLKRDEPLLLLEKT